MRFLEISRSDFRSVSSSSSPCSTGAIERRHHGARLDLSGRPVLEVDGVSRPVGRVEQGRAGESLVEHVDQEMRERSLREIALRRRLLGRLEARRASGCIEAERVARAGLRPEQYGAPARNGRRRGGIVASSTPRRRRRHGRGSRAGLRGLLLGRAPAKQTRLIVPGHRSRGAGRLLNLVVGLGLHLVDGNRRARKRWIGLPRKLRGQRVEVAPAARRRRLRGRCDRLDERHARPAFRRAEGAGVARKMAAIGGASRPPRDRDPSCGPLATGAPARLATGFRFRPREEARSAQVSSDRAGWLAANERSDAARVVRRRDDALDVALRLPRARPLREVELEVPWTAPPVASNTRRTRGCEYCDGCDGVCTTSATSPVESSTSVPVGKMPSAPKSSLSTVRSAASDASRSSRAMASSAESGAAPGAGVSKSLNARAVAMMRAWIVACRRPR